MERSYFCCSCYLQFKFLFWPRCEACGILVVPQPRIEHAPPAVEAWSLNHWITREDPGEKLLGKEMCF